MRRSEFHSHTGLSPDGSWSPLEMIREARERGQVVLALTDHVGVSNVEAVVEALRREREAALQAWSGIEVFVGVEITHAPVTLLADVAHRARNAGAEIIVVHGETLAEPVEPGTNRAALECPEVDVLAHPGLLTLAEAKLATESGIYLELSARARHSWTNGHVAQLAQSTGALLLVNTDAHSPHDLIDAETAVKIARGAGLSAAKARRSVEENAERLAVRLRNRRSRA